MTTEERTKLADRARAKRARRHPDELETRTIDDACPWCNGAGSLSPLSVCGACNGEGTRPVDVTQTRGEWRARDAYAADPPAYGTPHHYLGLPASKTLTEKQLAQARRYGWRERSTAPAPVQTFDNLPF